MNNDRLKCRYWHKPTNRYLRSAKLVYNDGTYTQVGTKQTSEWCYQSYIVAEYNTFDIVVEQCTGLTDNNGDLIFEGDIICTNDKTAGVVKFGKYGGNDWEGWHFGYYIDWLRYADIKNRKPTLRKDFWFWVEHREIEIIGNIHQNKELLK